MIWASLLKNHYNTRFMDKHIQVDMNYRIEKNRLKNRVKCTNRFRRFYKSTKRNRRVMTRNTGEKTWNSRMRKWRTQWYSLQETSRAWRIRGIYCRWGKGRTTIATYSWGGGPRHLNTTTRTTSNTITPIHKHWLTLNLPSTPHLPSHLSPPPIYISTSHSSTISTTKRMSFKANSLSSTNNHKTFNNNHPHHYSPYYNLSFNRLNLV